jgi:aminoglycoside phosphotransferase (APT) family kinase protein
MSHDSLPRSTASDDVAPVRPGEALDWSALQAYLRAELDELEGELEVLQFPHGAANLTYLLRFGPREYVLRRPPFGKIAPGAHDMAREYRVLSRLFLQYERAPRALLFCDDPAVMGSDFFVMERRMGTVIRGEIPASMARLPDVGHRIGLAVVDALADLHLVDAEACGLADLGRPEGFVGRQISGWRKRWELVRTEPRPTLMDEIGDRLEQTMPTTRRHAVVHNDFKLDNCQFDRADPDRVTTVFDWDMATLGDPLIDLGTLLNYWPDPVDGASAVRATHPGMRDMGLPPRAAIVERYVQRTGVQADDFRWYEAFAQWKTAIAVRQLYLRFASGETADERMIEIGDRMPGLASSAAEILGTLDPRPVAGADLTMWRWRIT